jgi:subtilisin family serine protease
MVSEVLTGGRIQVLMLLGSQEQLRESALASTAGRTPTSDLRTALVPAGFDMDHTFPAVPIGNARPGEISRADLAPLTSSQFVVRGYITADDPNQIPHDLSGNPIFSDTFIAPAPTCGGAAAIGSVADVAAKLNTAALAAHGLDGENVAVAIVDTGINLAHLAAKVGSFPRFDPANSWTPSGVDTLPGHYEPGHGTMCAYNVLSIAPKATLLDFPVLASDPAGRTIVGRKLSAAITAYSYLIANWGVSFGAGGVRARYKALVLNNSWVIYHPSWDFPIGHPGRYIDNLNHPFYSYVRILASEGVDIIFAAGNCGVECPAQPCQNRSMETIMGASTYNEVLTVAGCDTNDVRVGYSSQGPSIEKMPQQKPDVTAYTHFLGSEAMGPNKPDTGTSTACPIAAGCIAALRTKEWFDRMPPANLFDQLRVTARQVGRPPGWNADYGNGIINPVAAAQTMGLIGTV